VSDVGSPIDDLIMAALKPDSFTNETLNSVTQPPFSTIPPRPSDRNP
jgi:hypothetical protein